MKQLFLIITFIFIVTLGIEVNTVQAQTFCNPLNLNYRYTSDQASRREATDPTIVLFKDNYYLFATNAGGYWHSSDLISWNFITNTNLPLTNYAPTATVIKDTLYFFTSNCTKIYRSSNPSNGKWELYNSSFLLGAFFDPAIFADTDGKVYCYYGCSNDNRLMARELDVKKKLNPKGTPIVCLRKNPFAQPSRKPGLNQNKIEHPGIKSSWITKHNGKYYFQSTEPTEDFTNYNGVVYVSDSPLGPFTYAGSNPFSSKLKGFVSGANQGSTFADKYGNWWHVATISAPDKQITETRLGLFPAGFDSEGNLFANTSFGDYPIRLPDHKYADMNELNPGWSLLSYSKKAEASSNLSTNPVDLAFDENIGTYWSSATGNKNEWLSVDLGSPCTINAIQINFADHKLLHTKNDSLHSHQYIVEYSADKQNWKKLYERKDSTEVFTNHYEAISNPVIAQYVRITNYRVPDGTFAISGFRIFGSASIPKPNKLISIFAVKDFNDKRNIRLTWVKKGNVTGYNIRYGTQKDNLTHSYQVYKDAPVTLRVTDKNKIYWFAVDAFNESGVTPSDPHSSR